MNLPALDIWWPIASGLLGWVALLAMQIAALLIIPTRRKPAAARTWLLVFFLSPVVGLLLFIALGSPKLSARRRQHQRAMSHWLVGAARRARANPALDPIFDAPVAPRYAPIVRLCQRLGDLPAFGGNAVELLPGYQQAVDRIVADIDAARHYVHVLYYIFADDETGGKVVDALARACARGVRCRVLVDSLGSRSYVRALFGKLKAAGIEAHTVLPLTLLGRNRLRPDLRNHRKIVVVDGQVGYTGSQNLINPTYNYGKDLVYDELVARLSGPIALQLDAAFITDWFSETGHLIDVAEGALPGVLPQNPGGVLAQALPSGSAYDTENNLELFVSLLYAATSKAVITTPYFVPEESLLRAITSAVRRGVDVRLIVSGVADQFLVSRAQRSYYEELLDAGVRIFLYPPPTLLHTKTMHIDDDIVVIGTSNMDVRSFQLNLELSMAIYDTGVAAALAAIETGYMARAEEVSLTAWRQRPLLSRLVQNTARLVSEVL